MTSVLSPSFLFELYVGVFAIAGLVCLVSLHTLRRVEDPDTRRGLAWLLVLTGGWSVAHVAYLVAPSPSLQYVSFLTGLIFGIAAVGPWLYFCSAYSGRSLHRHRTVRFVAVATFLGIAMVKVTNPFHGLYFSVVTATEPFPHLGIQHEPLHWIVMGVAYALAIVGFFMLFELFVDVSYDTKPLMAVAGLTGIPVVFDLAGALTPYLLDITHSPVGVAAFAVGVLYVYVGRFQTVQLTADSENPVLLLDQDGRIREWNRAATTLIPALDNAHRKPLSAVAPALAEAVSGSSQRIDIDRDGTTRYYRVTTNPFSTDRARLGTMVVLSDITEREQHRRTIEHQNERLDEFARIVSHDLRNPLTVAAGQLSLARDTGDLDHLDAVERAHDRMTALIEDLLSLARSGLEIDETEPVALAEFARDSWAMVENPTATLEIEFDDAFHIQADPSRLQQLLENLYRNAIEHGGDDVTVTVGILPDDTGFYVADDGVGIPEADREHLFEPGFTTREAGTGFGLAIVDNIVSAHGWEIQVSENPTGGARFDITGVTGVA